MSSVTLLLLLLLLLVYHLVSQIYGRTLFIIPWLTRKASTATPRPSASVPTATSTATNSPDTANDSDSQAWIAGAVVGPVAGCAILAGLAFWFLRRRKKRTGIQNEEAAPAQQTAMESVSNPKYAGAPSELPGSVSYYGQKQGERPLSELAS